MKTKIFTTMILGMFALVFLVGNVSAVALNGINLVSKPSSVSNDAGSFNIVFDLTNDGVAGDLYYNLSNFTSSQSGLTISFNDNYIEASTTETITATITFNSGQTGTITGNINVGNTDSATDETLPFSVILEDATSSPSNVCAYDDGTSENNGDLRVDIKDISVVSGFGKDEEWLPLDEVEIEIKVENKGDWDIDDISLEWGIVGNDLDDDWVLELDEIDKFKLKNGDDKTFTVSFTVNEKDLDMNLDEVVGNDYNLLVRATGTVDDNDSPYDGDKTCASDSADVSFYEESDFVILSNLNMQDTATCAEQIQITADVFNIGTDDQDDVTVKISNKELGISETKTFSTIDTFDSEDLDVLITLPDDAEEKTYIFTFEVYDEYNDIYVGDYDDDDSVFTKTLTIEGCTVTPSSAIVTASLTSGGKAGQPLVVTATITNSDDKSATYSVNAATYASWANSVEVAPSTLTVNAGASKQVTFTFDVKDDASGTALFDIEVLSENQLVTTQPVQLQIEKSGFSIFAEEFSTPYLIIGAIIAVLILIAIVVLIIRLIK